MKPRRTLEENGYPVCCWIFTVLLIGAFVALIVVLATYPYPASTYYRGHPSTVRTNCTVGEYLDEELDMCAPFMNTPIPISHELMDINVKQCDSFFHHMSGKWIATHTNENRGFSYIYKRNRKQIHDIVLDPKSGPVYKFYRSCLDTLVNKQHKLLDKSQMKHVKEHILGAFKSHADLPIVFARLASYGFNSPFTITIEPHPTEFAMIPFIQREQPFEELPDMLYDLRECLRKLRLWHTDKEVEMGFIEYIQSELYIDDLIPIKYLLDSSPPNFWKLYLREFNGYNIEEIIDLNQTIWTIDIQYLHSLMHGLSEISYNEWKAYIEYSVDYNTNQFLPDIPYESFFRDFTFLNKHKKHRIQRDASIKFTNENCIDITYKMLPGVIGNMYLQKNDIDKIQVTQIVENVRDSLADIIEETPWLSNETKSKIVEKVRAIIVRSVSPNFYEEEPFLERLTMDNYLRNINIVRRYLATKNLGLWTNDSPNRDYIQKFGSPLSEVNAFYSPISNTITIFAGLLNKPFYDKKFPNVALFAIIGLISGHELSHSIDNSGRFFDKDGSLSRTEPWLPEEYAEFRNRTNRLISEYEAPNGCNNAHYGEITLGEDISDIIGLKSAYRAWLRVEPNATLEQKQWFFQIFGQMWAEQYDQKELCKRVAGDVHAIGQYRVDKTLRQMKEFKEVFNCKIGDGMVNSNPVLIYGA
jgi:predicted metalloendopeptidase